MTLEDLLKTKVNVKAVIDGNEREAEVTPDFRVAVQHDVDSSRGVHFIIHPSGHDGETLDFLVVGNELTQL